MPSYLSTTREARGRRRSTRLFFLCSELRLLQGVEILDRLDHSGCERRGRIVVARRVIRALGDLDDLDCAVLDVERETLAPADDADAVRSRVDHLHPDRLGENSRRVAQQ